MKKKTVWSVFRDFVNTKPLGAIVSRTEIMQQLRREGFISVNGLFEHKDKDKTLYSPATLDSARNMAEKVGYLGKTARLGYYEVLNHFPSEYTVSQLRKDYDNGYNCNN